VPQRIDGVDHVVRKRHAPSWRCPPPGVLHRYLAVEIVIAVGQRLGLGVNLLDELLALS